MSRKVETDPVAAPTCAMCGGAMRGVKERDGRTGVPLCSVRCRKRHEKLQLEIPK